MNKQEKEYVFRSIKTIEKEDFVIAESYEEAEKIFSDYLYCGDDWECVRNPDSKESDNER